MKIRFRVRTAFAVVTIVTILTGWAATNHAAFMAEQRLLVQLKPEHGYLVVSDSHGAGSICAFGARGFVSREPTTVLSRALSGVSPPLFERVTKLSLTALEYDDSALEVVSQFPNLKEFDCVHTSATASGVEKFRQARPHVSVRFEKVAQDEVSNTFFASDANDPF
jgi:hypothetical protein